MIHNSTKQQNELVTKQMKFGELVEGFLSSLYKARRHYITYVWTDHVIRRLKEGLDPDRGEALCTDFSANMNLRARLTDNSSVDSHAIIQVFQSFCAHCKVPFTRQNDGQQDLHLLTSCEVDQFIGGSDSPGKANNHQYHVACLLALIEKKERKRIQKYNETGLPIPYTYYVISDNCGNQYKCRHNFIFLASICNDRFPN